jgi:hypothetical protein
MSAKLHFPTRTARWQPTFSWKGASRELLHCGVKDLRSGLQWQRVGAQLRRFGDVSRRSYRIGRTSDAEDTKLGCFS